MTRRLPLLTALLLLAVSAAGCLSGDEPVTPAAAEETVTPAVGTPPGSNETAQVARDLGHEPHIHDYWNGRERVTLLDADVEPGGGDALNWVFYQAWYAQDSGKAGVVFVSIPEGMTVYEGTGRLEITATWSDPRVTSLSVAHRVGEREEFSAFQALASGETQAVDVTPDMTDLPHMTRSRWQFAFRPADAPGTALGPFHVKIDIVKMRDIGLFPGHPELFEGKPSKVLLDRDGESQQVSYAKRAPNVVTDGEFGEHWITPDHLVPLETKSMRVEVNLTRAEASVGEVSEIRLYYVSADTFNPVRAEVVEGEINGDHWVYTLPVEPHMVDTPYGAESQWRILVEAATTVAGMEEERTCGGCVDTDIAFHVILAAYDHDWRAGTPDEAAA